MESEYSILEDRWLPQKPDQSRPASTDARAAMSDYSSALKDFKVAFQNILTSLNQPPTLDTALELFKHIDHAIWLAGFVRVRALALSAYPTAFNSFGDNAVYYTAVADVAEEAYRSRISELQKIEKSLRSQRGDAGRPWRGILLSHEGFKGGHLISRHVAWTRDNFRQRFLDEDANPKRQRQNILSSFFDLETAEEVVWRVLAMNGELLLNRKLITREEEGKPLWLKFSESRAVGYVKKRGKNLYLTNTGAILVIIDSGHPCGFRIVTAKLVSKKKEQ